MQAELSKLDWIFTASCIDSQTSLFDHVDFWNTVKSFFPFHLQLVFFYTLLTTKKDKSENSSADQ